MQLLNIDRERITFDVPGAHGPGELVLRSNRLIAHFTPQSDEDDSWLVIRSQNYRYALMFFSHLLAARKIKKTISTDAARAVWEESWQQYVSRDYVSDRNLQHISLLTSCGLNWVSGMHSHVIKMEERLLGQQVTQPFLHQYARDVLNVAGGSSSIDFESKRALVLTFNRRGDAKITMWNRDLHIKGESMSYIVPCDIEADHAMVAVDLAAKYTELLGGISFFNVLRHKLMVEGDTSYVKQRKDAKHLTRDLLLDLNQVANRIISASNIEFFPEQPDIAIPM